MKLVHYFTLIFFRYRELQEENRVLAVREGDIASKEKEIAERIEERSESFLEVPVTCDSSTSTLLLVCLLACSVTYLFI